MSEQYKRKPNSNCILCDKAVYRRPVEIERNNGHVFCSLTCYGKSCRKEKPCVECGKLILSGENKKTCSRSCANRQISGIRYRINKPKDKVKASRLLRFRLLKLREDKCERCNYRIKEVLQVHHKDRNRKNNSLDNLELVCPNCHFEEHYLKK